MDAWPLAVPKKVVAVSQRCIPLIKTCWVIHVSCVEIVEAWIKVSAVWLNVFQLEECQVKPIPECVATISCKKQPISVNGLNKHAKRLK
jgi:DNA recombination-dependent growth factor C